jgi:hypothetical protein
MQADLCFEVRLPKQDSMTYELLMALKMGKRLTPLNALQEHACLSLSQRMGELKRAGWPITVRMIQVQSGKRVAEYSLA